MIADAESRRPLEPDRFNLVIVAPAFNEALGLAEFTEQVAKNLPPDTPSLLVIVNDGSADRTEEVLNDIVSRKTFGKLQVHALNLSRNFGHQSASLAGLSYAVEKSNTETKILLMDADLEHPPALIPKIYEHMNTHAVDHLQMVRSDANRNISLLKKITSSLFYKIFNTFSQIKLDMGSADFRCMNLRFVVEFTSLPEVDRFNRGLFTWLGFRTSKMPYEANDREYGKTSYTLSRMFKLAVTGITSFSSRPLLIISGLAFILAAVFCSVYAIFEIYKFFVLKAQFAVGYPTIVFFIFFWGGLISFILFVQSIYVAKTFTEIKKRPQYVVRNTIQ